MDFAQYDRLSDWQADALSALRSLQYASSPLPTWIVGISEGGEIIAQLAEALGIDLQGIILLSASGLDPSESIQHQLARRGQDQGLMAIGQAAASDQSDRTILHGRSLGYWRDMLTWRVSEFLLRRNWTILHVWGDEDELVPSSAYERFLELAQNMPAKICSLRWQQGDHGLHSPTHGPAQPRIWHLVSNWAQISKGGCPELGLGK